MPRTKSTENKRAAPVLSGPQALDKLMPDIETAEKARDALNKAQAIEDAVYDLKAVSPREKKTTDTRTPSQLLAAIKDKGIEVDAALGRLGALLEAPP